MKKYNKTFEEDGSVFDEGTDILIQVICAIWMLGIIGFVLAGILAMFGII